VARHKMQPTMLRLEVLAVLQAQHPHAPSVQLLLLLLGRLDSTSGTVLMATGSVTRAPGSSEAGLPAA
jgi:Fe2+ or Zn2+ uptake regulation protein